MNFRYPLGDRVLCFFSDKFTPIVLADRARVSSINIKLNSAVTTIKCNRFQVRKLDFQ